MPPPDGHPGQAAGAPVAPVPRHLRFPFTTPAAARSPPRTPGRSAVGVTLGAAWRDAIGGTQPAAALGPPLGGSRHHLELAAGERSRPWAAHVEALGMVHPQLRRARARISGRSTYSATVSLPMGGRCW